MGISFTDRELDVMGVLWERGSGTVSEVRDALHDELAYTTVLTILRTLEEKEYVTHVAEGRAHRYVPAVSQEVAGGSALVRLLDKVFAGSPEMLFTQLVSERNLDPKTLRRIRKMLDDHLAARTRRT